MIDAYELDDCVYQKFNSDRTKSAVLYDLGPDYILRYCVDLDGDSILLTEVRSEAVDVFSNLNFGIVV